MDIISRLKEYISFLGVQVTQFADNCSIPRPSMSQLLNGRNKKVSNELIGKIHTAYPDLSIMWLMFGQGSMLTNSSTPISEPQNVAKIDFSASHTADNGEVTSRTTSKNPYKDFTSENIDGISDSIYDQADQPNDKIQDSSETEQPSETTFAGNAPSSPMTIPTDGTKQIVNIIVYYSDNSFESFSPTR